MALIWVGLLLLVLKLGGWVQFSESNFWSWVIVLSPFIGAALWWAWSDATGLTEKRAMDALDKKKADRRAKQLEALGRGPKKGR